MTDRFEFENKLIQFSTVIDDLREISNRDYNQELSTIADYYDLKFRHLWDMFEKMIAEGNIK